MIRNSLIIAALLAAPALAADPPASPASPPPATKDCLITRNIADTGAYPDGHWYAKLRDKTWWRNTMSCPGLAPNRALIHTSPIGSQCRGDVVQVVDFGLGGVAFGGCGLGSWEKVDGPPGKDARRK
jgi:hypothetical protein